MAVEPRDRFDPGYTAISVQLHPTLRQIKIDRAAPDPGRLQCLEGTVERGDDGIYQRLGCVVRIAVARRIHLLVCQSRSGTHYTPYEFVAAQTAV